MARHDRSKDPPMFRSPPREIANPQSLTVSPADVPLILLVIWHGCPWVDRPLFEIPGYPQRWAREQNAGVS